MYFRHTTFGNAIAGLVLLATIAGSFYAGYKACEAGWGLDVTVTRDRPQ